MVTGVPRQEAIIARMLVLVTESLAGYIKGY
jgi:hypothetical protein